MTMRVYYAAGPGDVVGTFGHWLKGESDPNEMTVTYSGQFFNVCKSEGLVALVVSSHQRRDYAHAGSITVKHLPMPLKRATGLVWHLQQIIYGFRLLWDLMLFRPDIAVIGTGTHWFLLSPLALLGVKVVPTLHCTLWRKGEVLGRARRTINYLNRKLLFEKCFAVLSASNDITRQFRRLVANVPVPALQFLPTYDAGRPIPRQTNRDASARRTVLYIGRIEKNKGVADLLSAVSRLKKEIRIQLHFCGAGSYLDELRALAERERMGDAAVFHGHMPRDRLHQLLPMADALVVPTTSDFVEGFNQVVVEGVLAAVPTITTDVCPATEYVKGSVLLFEAGNVEALADKLRLVLLDAGVRTQLVERSKMQAAYFYNACNGWEPAFREVVRCAKLGRTPKDKTVPLESPLSP